jgi:eukaryotic-like serine/threonine-protein kinase
LAIQQRALGPDHQDIAGSLDNLAAALLGRGKLAEAEALERLALAMRRKLLGDEHLDVALSLNNLAHVLHAAGQLAEAESLHRQALALRKRLLGNEHADVAASLAGLADVLHDASKLAEAESCQREELAIRRQLVQAVSPPLPSALEGLVDAFSRLTRTMLAAGKFAAAEPLAREWLALGEKEMPDDWQTFNARSALGASLLGQKKPADAEPLLLTGYEGLKQRAGKLPTELKPSRLKEAAQRLVQLYEAVNRSDQAEAWKQKLDALVE